MNSFTHLSLARTSRRFSTEAIAPFAPTEVHAARITALGHPPANRSAAVSGRFWDSSLIDRLSAPLSRVRE
jgi:hypothetical protein